MTRLRGDNRPQVHPGNTLSSEVGSLRRDKTHCGQRARCGVPLPVTLTCVDEVRPHRPQIPHLGSHVPLVRTLRPAVQAPSVGTSQVPGTSQDCRKKYRVCLLYQHSSQRSQSASVYTSVLLFCFERFHAKVEHGTLVLAGLGPFLSR